MSIVDPPPLEINPVITLSEALDLAGSGTSPADHLIHTAMCTACITSPAADLVGSQWANRPRLYKAFCTLKPACSKREEMDGMSGWQKGLRADSFPAAL